jgi:hypothetical protein
MMREFIDYNSSGLPEQGVRKVTIIPGSLNSGQPAEKLRFL